MQIPKYSQLKIEKRGLVENTLLPDLSKLKCRVVEDRYLHAGRLRLQKINWTDGENHCIYKLCKKYDFPKSESKNNFSVPIVNVYLSLSEYELLAVLTRNNLLKKRYTYEYKTKLFSVDEFYQPVSDLYLCEIEADSVEELAKINFPPFVVEDVTSNSFYTGANLAKIKYPRE